ncbi:MAG TPA: hypothetical protein ENN46_03935 [Candidatus Woesearchaeota archaeon]|nr:hypothetical protein [Candidatus Woesearchaeota archaeon]
MVAASLILAGSYIAGFLIAKETGEEISEIKGFLGKASLLLLAACTAITLTGIGTSAMLSIASASAFAACLFYRRLFLMVAGLALSASPQLIFPMLLFVSFSYATEYYKKGLKGFFVANRLDFLISGAFIIAQILLSFLKLSLI